MRTIILYFLGPFLLMSCIKKPQVEQKSESEHVSAQKNESVSQKPEVEQVQVDSSKVHFYELLSEAIETFPEDSASLSRFYLRISQGKSEQEINKLELRIEHILNQDYVRKYEDVATNLKPLMEEIVSLNSINKSQSERLAKLYSIYDNFRGGALFSNLLNNDENYTLTWASFRIMASSSSTDTCFISDLINLDDAIRTNAELAEAMGDFIHEAIKNNPEGFLDMYAARSENNKNSLVEYCKSWGDPVEEIIALFTDISINSTSKEYKSLASELLKKISN